MLHMTQQVLHGASNLDDLLLLTNLLPAYVQSVSSRILLGLRLLNQSIKHVALCLTVAMTLYYGCQEYADSRTDLWKTTVMLPRVVLPHCC